MRSFCFQPPARWPFWLLLAAWFCANTPQIALHAILAWADEARQFSHQQRLSSEVAFLLVGEKAPGFAAKFAESADSRSRPPAPATTVLKKIELAVEATAEILPPALRADRPDTPVEPCPEVWRAPPPHGPPRVSVSFLV